MKMTCACFMIFTHTFSAGNTQLTEQWQASRDCHLSVWKDAKIPENNHKPNPHLPLALAGTEGSQCDKHRNENCGLIQLPKKRWN